MGGVHGTGASVVMTISLMAGCFCFVALAGLIDRFGLGNGYSILLLTEVVVQAQELTRNMRA